MARYIDADKLTDKLEELQFNAPVMTPVMKIYSVIELVEDQPTADVVEVVRCKDCKHFTKEMIAGDLEFICKSAEGMINPAPDKYCSCGTPKERGGEK